MRPPSPSRAPGAPAWRDDFPNLIETFAGPGGEEAMRCAAGRTEGAGPFAAGAPGPEAGVAARREALRTAIPARASI